MFHAKVCKAYDSVIEKCGEKETLIQYKVINAKKHFCHTIEYDSSTSNIICSCKKFEFVLSNCLTIKMFQPGFRLISNILVVCYKDVKNEKILLIGSG